MSGNKHSSSRCTRAITGTSATSVIAGMSSRACLAIRREEEVVGDKEEETAEKTCGSHVRYAYI